MPYRPSDPSKEGQMLKLLCRIFCYIVFATPGLFGQTASKIGWGPWQYTDFKVSGIEFRSKCLSSSGVDSRWAYQFRSRHDRTSDFVERHEDGFDDGTTNGFDRPEAFTLEAGALSPVFETRMHGTCEQLHKLRIEIMCDSVHEYYGDDPCFRDENGTPLEFKRIPDKPRYQ
jgi:hypothetical protein